jgi:hypothetical protein
MAHGVEPIMQFAAEVALGVTPDTAPGHRALMRMRHMAWSGTFPEELDEDD